MPGPDMPLEERALRFVVANAYTTGAGVKTGQVDAFLKRDSIPFLRTLEERKLLHHAPGGAWLPTGVGQTVIEEFSGDVHQTVAAIIEYGKRRIDTGDESKRRVEIDELARALDESSPEPRRLFELSSIVHGLDPFVFTQSETDDGIARAVLFTPRLYDVSSLEEILAAREKADASTQQFHSWDQVARTEPPDGLPALVRALAKEYEQGAALAEILLRDALEVETCRGAHAFKSTLVLCGSLLEGVLVDILEARPDLVAPVFSRIRSARAKFPDDASLENLLHLATVPLHDSLTPLLRPAHQAHASALINHRDLVHPHREVRGETLAVDQITSELIYNLLRTVLRDITSSLRSGWIVQYKAA